MVTEQLSSTGNDSQSKSTLQGALQRPEGLEDTIGFLEELYAVYIFKLPITSHLDMKGKSMHIKISKILSIIPSINQYLKTYV